MIYNKEPTMASLLSIRKLGTESNPTDPNPVVPSISLNLRNGSVDHTAIACKYRDFINKSLSNGLGEQAQANLQWKNITVTTEKNKPILNSVSGEACAGKLTAIMGPSGAGKSTLLNVLSGLKRKNVTGEVLVNGKPRDLHVFRKTCSYIMQDSFLHPMITVHESITFATLLKSPSNSPKAEKLKSVNKCIELLGLTQCKNTKVSVLSGGEKKRLSIGVELVSNPMIMFLDEPTSGLDSSSCVQCIQLLRALASEGKTVICTIHQPTTKILDSFDQLYTLAEGSCIYRGTVDDLIPHLRNQGIYCPQHKNPAEILMDLACEESENWTETLSKAVDYQSDQFSRASSLNELSNSQHRSFEISTTCLINTDGKEVNKNGSTSTGYAVSSFQQFIILLKRNLLCTYREPLTTQARFAAHVIFGLLMGALYYGKGDDANSVFNITSFLLCSAAFLIFTAAIPSILSFPVEKEIIAWEHMNNWYSIKMYFLSKIIIETIFQILLTVLYCSIVYWMTDQPNELWRFGLFTLTFIIICLATQSIVMNIGIMFSLQSSTFVGSSVNFPFLLFSGFFIPLESTPYYLRWLSYVSYLQYGFRSIMHIIYGMERPNLSCEKGLCIFRKPTYYLKMMGMDYGDIYTEYAVLIAFFIVFKILAYFLLRYRLTRNK